MPRNKNASEKASSDAWPLCVMCLERVYNPEVTKGACNWCLKKSTTGWKEFESYRESKKDLVIDPNKAGKKRSAKEGIIKNSEITYFKGVPRLFEYKGVRYRAPEGSYFRPADKCFFLDVMMSNGEWRRLLPEDFENDMNRLLDEVTKITGNERPIVPIEVFSMGDCVPTDETGNYDFNGRKMDGLIFKVKDRPFVMPFTAKLAKSNYKSLVFSIRGVTGNVFVNVNNYRQIEDAVLDVWVEYLKVLDQKKTTFVEKQKKNITEV